MMGDIHELTAQLTALEKEKHMQRSEAERLTKSVHTMQTKLDDTVAALAASERTAMSARHEYDKQFAEQGRRATQLESQLQNVAESLDGENIAKFEVERILMAFKEEMVRKAEYEAIVFSEALNKERNAKEAALAQVKGLKWKLTEVQASLEMLKQKHEELLTQHEVLVQKWALNEPLIEQMSSLEDQVASSLRELETIMFDRMSQDVLTRIFANRMYRMRARSAAEGYNGEDERTDWTKAASEVQVTLNRIQGSPEDRMGAVLQVLDDLAHMLEDTSVTDLPAETTQLIAEVSRLSAALLQTDRARLASLKADAAAKNAGIVPGEPTYTLTQYEQ